MAQISLIRASTIFVEGYNTHNTREVSFAEEGKIERIPPLDQ